MFKVAKNQGLKRFKITFFLNVLILLALINTHDVYGFSNPWLPNDLQNLSGSEYFAKFLPAVITLLLLIGTLIFLFMIIQGGIEWIGSGGDKAKYESARNRVTNALVGLVILFSVFAIIDLVERFFGVNISVFDISSFSINN